MTSYFSHRKLLSCAWLGFFFGSLELCKRKEEAKDLRLFRARAALSDKAPAGLIAGFSPPSAISRRRRVGPSRPAQIKNTWRKLPLAWANKQCLSPNCERWGSYTTLPTCLAVHSSVCGAASIRLRFQACRSWQRAVKSMQKSAADFLAIINWVHCSQSEVFNENYSRALHVDCLLPLLTIFLSHATPLVFTF